MSAVQRIALPARKRSTSKRKLRKWTLCLLASPLLLVLSIASLFYWTTQSYIHANLDDIRSAPVAIVFGAGLQKGGRPSRVLRSRLDGSIELYRQGKVQKLLLSGDNRTRYYNEPAAMQKYAIEHRVPKRDIILDYAGRDTYDTCYRARNVFGFTNAVLVTQAYHAPRAIYVARRMGIEAEAYAVPNLDQFPLLQMSYTVREYMADSKAFWDVQISHRKPYAVQETEH